jgi:hypothetical protein
MQQELARLQAELATMNVAPATPMTPATPVTPVTTPVATPSPVATGTPVATPQAPVASPALVQVNTAQAAVALVAQSAIPVDPTIQAKIDQL